MRASMRVADALLQARDARVERLDAQLLLAHVFSRPRTWLLAHDDAALGPEQAAQWAALLARRAAGEPLAYVVGETVFCGLRLELTPDVLVPRPETELLVDWACELLAGTPTSSCVDLGTGSGAVALALKQAHPQLAVCASDASAAALTVARGNSARLALAVELVHGDWWQPLAGRRFGLALSNPPYVAAADPHLAALAHEPHAALTPGGDGLSALRRIVAGAPVQLLPGAWLLLEHGHDQGTAVRSMLAAAGFVGAQTRCDLAGLPRCSGAALPWPAAIR